MSSPAQRAESPVTVNVHEAKTHLSALLRRVEAGEEITIARPGKAVARLVAVGDGQGPRKLGWWRGQGWIADDFDAPIPELEESIERPL